MCTGNHDISSSAAKVNSKNRESLINKAKEELGNELREEFIDKVKEELTNQAREELIPDTPEGRIYEKFSEFISFVREKLILKLI